MIIYVRKRIIVRNGKPVEGFQAALNMNKRSGPTSTDREQVIEHYRKLAKKYGDTIERIVDL